MILLYIVAVVAIALVCLILYTRWNYGYLESLGIPVEKPSFILGSEPQMHKLILHEEDMKRMKKFGPIWGFYEGREPHVYITDPDMIRLILLKDFDHFHDRRHLDFGHPLINEMMDVLPDEKWKVVRNGMTPTFTTGKIRHMSEKIKEAVQDCVENIEKECKTSHVFDLKRIYTALTTDVIARCAFGTKLNSINDPNNVFVRMVTKLSGDSNDPNFLLTWVAAFPFLSKTIPFIPPEALEFFGGVLRNIMDARRSQKSKENDIVDALNELRDKIPTEEYQRLGITETTVMCQALIFLLAGFDTTATTLTMISYRLATNPDKQRKLIEELDQVLQRNNGKIDHDTLADLPYLNACVNESLRMCPPLIRLERECMKDWKHEESGLALKKGTVVQIPTFCVHYNDKYWPESDKFKPERFLSENKTKTHPYAFLSFGQGPRNCIGSRFAREEINLAVAMILKNFTFETTPETKVQFKNGRIFLVQYQPVHIQMTRRIQKDN